MLLLEMGTEGKKAVVNAAPHWFALKRGNQDRDSLAFRDEHPLDLRRFYDNRLALWRGSLDLWGGEAGILPEASADRCPEDYTKKSRSWQTLLAPYTR